MGDDQLLQHTSLIFPLNSNSCKSDHDVKYALTNQKVLQEVYLSAVDVKNHIPEIYSSTDRILSRFPMSGDEISVYLSHLASSQKLVTNHFVFELLKSHFLTDAPDHSCILFILYIGLLIKLNEKIYNQVALACPIKFYSVTKFVDLFVGTNIFSKL